MKGLFFDTSKQWWEGEWQDMPEFVQDDQSPIKTIYVHFQNKEDMEAFAKLVNQKITSKTKSIWYPKVEREILLNKLYIDEENES